MSLAVLEPLKVPERVRLEIVSQWDRSVPVTRIKPQILIPPAFAPVPKPLAPGEHRTFVVFNQKGGAGKTTAALELACAWVAMGYTVRIIDMDPQTAGMTEWLAPQYPDGVAERDRKTLLDVLYGKAPLDAATYFTQYQNLYLVPSYEDCEVAEHDPRVAKESLLRTAIRKSNAPVDITILDCPPNLGKLSTYSLATGGEILVPLQTSGVDEMSNKALLRTIRTAQEEYPEIVVRAVILTAWAKTTIARDITWDVTEQYPEAMIAPVRRTVQATEAPRKREPIRVYARGSATARDLDQIARIILPARETV